MKGKAQMWADQTLNTGVRYGLTREVLAATAQILTGMGVDLFDIQLTAWRKTPYTIADFAFSDKARCIIDASQEQVESAWQEGFANLVITYTFQRWRDCIQDLAAVLSAAYNYGLSTSLHIVNASETDAESIRGFFSLVRQYAVKTLIIGDRDSRLEPLQTFAIMKRLSADTPCDLGFHAHNSYGLATANAYAAMQAGASELAVSVAGIGCCGHAAFEEVLLAAQGLAGQNIAISNTLASDAKTVLALQGYETPSNKAVIGQHIFSHESGIHVNGIAKDHRLYEAFSPETVGLSRRVVIGKHSGTTSLRTKFEEWGLTLDERTARQLLKKIRRLAVAKKNVVEDIQLKRLYYRMLKRSRIRMQMSPWEATAYE